ncbi:MAG: type I DNA topoisomerase, partial [Myxococcota bacterium]
VSVLQKILQLLDVRLLLRVDDIERPKIVFDVDPEKKAHIKKLKDLLKDTDELLLATDEDREGESIAWHLLEVLKPKVPVKRMVFHEITKSAILEAIENPRDINRNLVDAQEARRVLDRLYGYEVSPVLWKKVMPRLSAGRVQSVATRIIVERERERMRFQSATYWDIDAELSAEGERFPSKLVSVDGKRIAQGKDFDDATGKLKNPDALLLNEADATAIAKGLETATIRVTSVEQKPYTRKPSAPFMTSTLQQEASRKLRFSTSRTMRAAQRLYEAGFITYMRTDSTTLSEAALTGSRAAIQRLYGAEYVPKEPRLYRNKVKNAQEAHEAIRPAGTDFKRPQDIPGLHPDEAKVYELVWKRTIASQMADARGQRMAVKIEATLADGRKVQLSTSGLTITFPGFLRAYVEGSAKPSAELGERERHLPSLEEGQGVNAEEVKAEGHETQPPARFTEATLVRRLEELGVGRPSTYASTISTIQDRGYVWRRANALVPTYKALAVVTLLEKHFGHLVDYAFTARMEDELDEIAQGQQKTVPYLKRFYFGGDAPANQNGTPSNGAGVGLRDLVARELEAIDARAINTLPLGEDSEGRMVAVRVGRYGPYLQRGEDTVGIPEDLPPAQLDLEKATELLEAPSGDRELGADPESGKTVYLRSGRFGTYVQLGEVVDGEDKPKTASLLSAMNAEDLSLADALKLLSLPRLVGKDDAGEEITATNGRYGPYIMRGKDRRSLKEEEEIFTVTVPQALALLAEPPRRGRRAAAKPPLKELGDDPVSEKLITLREGRFGPYVTDGDTNASLRTGDDPDTITPERAQELLQLRREKAPTKKPTKRAASKKKKTSKKATKKAAKKATKKVAKKATKKAAKKATKKAAKKAAKKSVASNDKPTGSAPATDSP